MEEVRKLSRPTVLRFPLGISASTGRRFSLSGADLEKSVLITGPTGSGKTSGLIEPLVKWIVRHPMRPGAIIPDVKDGYARLVEEEIRAAGLEENRLVHLRPGGRHRLNLLDPSIPSAKLASLLIESALAPGEARHAGMAFWIQAGERTLNLMIALERAALGPENVTLREIRSLSTSLYGRSYEPMPRPEDELPREASLLLSLLAHRVAEIPTDHPDRAHLTAELRGIREDLYRLVRLDDKVKTSILSEIDRPLGAIQDPRVAEILCAPAGEATVSIPEIIDEGKILVLDLPPQRYGLAGRLAGFMIRAQAYAHLMATRTEGRGRTEKPMYFIMDEAQTLLRLGESGDSDNNFSAVARSLGARLVIATQQLAGLYAATEDRHFVDQLVENLRVQVHLRQGMSPELQRIFESRNISPNVALYLTSVAPRFTGVVLTDRDHDVVGLEPAFLKGGKDSSGDGEEENWHERRFRALREIGGLLPPEGAMPMKFLVACGSAEEAAEYLDDAETKIRSHGGFYLRFDGRSIGLEDPGMELAKTSRFRVDRAEGGILLIDRLDQVPSTFQAWKSIAQLVEGGRFNGGLPGFRIDLSKVAILATVVDAVESGAGLPLPGRPRRGGFTLPKPLRARFRISRLARPLEKESEESRENFPHEVER